MAENRFVEQKTRNIVIERLIKTLTTTSILSRTHGSFSIDEATGTAKIIEEESYNAAIASANDDGIKIISVYANEISRRLLKANKEKRFVEQHQKEIVACVLDWRYRHAIMERTIDILTSPPTSYCTLEATAITHFIEEKAFSFTIASAQSTSGDNGILNLYLEEFTEGLLNYEEDKDNAKAKAPDMQAQVNATSISSPSSSPKWSLDSFLDRFVSLYDRLIPYVIPYVTWRWLVAFALAVFFVLRIQYLRYGIYVCFQFGVIIMVKFPDFLSPIDGALLPLDPFIRKCPEHEFWFLVMLSLCISIPMTFIDFLDVPAHWLIPFLSWLLLCYLALENPIKGMIKYKYLPFNFRKQTYGKKPASSNGALKD